MSSRVASRYAKSLLELAQTNGSDAAVYSDMQAIVDLAKQNKDFSELLNNPVVKASDKLAVIKKVILDTNPLTVQLIELVVDKKRENELVNIADDFISKFDAQKGVTKVLVRSAISLDDATLQNVKHYLKGIVTNEEIHIENVVDPSVLGGMVIKFEDKLLDMSVAKELKEIRKQLIYN
ncbi:MAG: ATP synthase F1 subunit delta [Flavobacteriales bacterium]|nr:ATP synthase F1 subunit delta [Flavobacteriales bacterium]